MKLYNFYRRFIEKHYLIKFLIKIIHKKIDFE